MVVVLRRDVRRDRRLGGHRGLRMQQSASSQNLVRKLLFRSSGLWPEPEAKPIFLLNESSVFLLKDFLTLLFVTRIGVSNYLANIEMATMTPLIENIFEIVL